MTSSMMSERSLAGMQLGLTRLARVQEQLTTGRIINRPSDSPIDATSAMSMRKGVAEQKQFVRNTQDGLGWLNTADSTLSQMNSQIRRARELGLQGANTGAMSADSRNAVATELEQIRDGLIQLSNTAYLGRPIFGGITAGSKAFDPSGAFVGVAGAVTRTVAPGVRIDVNVDGAAVVGPAGDTVFDTLTDLAAALRAGDSAATAVGLDGLASALKRVTTSLSDVGSRTVRVETAEQAALDADLRLTGSLSEVENTDLPKAIMELKLQETAYQAALASTARVMQPSLLDFLR
ncbi:flagellar hook-associated protein FlgL [Nocardioides sp. InS609-2]|uniref:flagellar hook-associated protein FlgL n=1 Tax=Nocardioides sp. InS609-2 TaxID=2760705 RepID=UPI0018003F87|nr:flagellar hook-associated protein FlgL [Nocardioides sp. InS609-2]MBA3781759.1 flagellar hook-associated protein FlgL [Nocardioides sp.]